jgi:response regulator RpfG family c-di-GMP phosphodiesterase
MTETVTESRKTSSRPRILVVDDDRDVLDSLVELLRRDYEVVSTSDPAEAASILQADQDLALILTDQRMPGKTGVELLAEAARRNPETVRMLFTGYSDISAVIAAINDGFVYRYITKPWEPEELLANVAAAVRTYAVAAENVRLTAELKAALDQTQREKDRVRRLERDEPALGERNTILAQAIDDLRDSHWLLRRIQNVLPICAYCGKVRVAEAHWQSVEDFLRENSDFLSHGVCPDCLKKLEV